MCEAACSYECSTRKNSHANDVPLFQSHVTSIESNKRAADDE
jgi:hypothetical protein